MSRRETVQPARSAWWVREALIVGAALLAALAVSRAWAVDKPETRKMAQQMDVMEQILDEVLVDSPNFLVFGRDHVHALFVQSYGVILTFEASLVGHDGEEFDFKNWGGGGFTIETKDGEKVIVIGPDDVPEPPEPPEPGEPGKKPGKEENPHSRVQKRYERIYNRGKTELVDVLLDYGDTLTSLKVGQRVAIVAKLIDSDYFKDKKISHLVLEAKIDDLRAYAGDKLSEKEMVTRIVEKEY